MFKQLKFNPIAHNCEVLIRNKVIIHGTNFTP